MSIRRGIPGTGGIRDPKTRQVIDAIVENLRAIGESAPAAALVSMGGAVASVVRSAVLRLVNSGGGTPVGVSIAADTLTLRTLKGSANIQLAIVDGAIVISTGDGTWTVTGAAPIEVTVGGEVSINVPGLAAETFAAGSHVFLVHNGAAYKKVSLGNFAGVSSTGQAQWKIPVVNATGSIEFKTITELLLGAVTTTKDPVVGDKPLTLDSLSALFWANSGECP